MNVREFNTLLEKPSEINAEKLPQLEQLSSEYPYFQPARILYLLGLRKFKDHRYERNLPVVAAYSLDRSRLREQILDMDTLSDEKITEALNSSSLINEKQKLEEQLRLLDEQIQSELEEIEIRRAQLRELIQEKKEMLGNLEHGPKEEIETAEKSPRALPKDEMLEEFLEEQKDIKRAGDFYNPIEKAHRSLVDSENIVSETLAKILVTQGNFQKAIKIYKKLSLKYPEKSSYFAAQIENLKQNLKE